MAEWARNNLNKWGIYPHPLVDKTTYGVRVRAEINKGELLAGIRTYTSMEEGYFKHYPEDRQKLDFRLSEYTRLVYYYMAGPLYFQKELHSKGHYIFVTISSRDLVGKSTARSIMALLPEDEGVDLKLVMNTIEISTWYPHIHICPVDNGCLKVSSKQIQDLLKLADKSGNVND
jgi:hypothetical protein